MPCGLDLHKYRLDGTLNITKSMVLAWHRENASRKSSGTTSSVIFLLRSWAHSLNTLTAHKVFLSVFLDLFPLAISLVYLLNKGEANLEVF